MRRSSLVSLAVLVAALAGGGSTAAGSVTIGQTGSDPFTGCVGVNTYDLLQPTITTGTSYVVPAPGVITSWSHSARDELNQEVTMKLWRLVSGNTYRAIGHDGPRPLTAGVVNTFSGISIPVQAGEVLGLNVSAGAYTACHFPAPGDTVLQSAMNAADGQEATFAAVSGFRANVSAVLEPDADRDGFGDETQDRCPTSATTQGACPPQCPRDATSQAPCPQNPPPAPSVATCKGEPATIVGTAGNDVRTGTPGRDVMVGNGGNDSLFGLAGRDLICGNSGRDRLAGGKGRDTLLGQKGRDALKGGGAKDVCTGGGGKDTATCEVEKSI